MTPPKIIRYFLLQHFLPKMLRSQEDQLRDQVISIRPVPLEKCINLFLNPFTWWYSVHGVGFLSARKGSGFVINQRISHAAYFYSIIRTSPFHLQINRKFNFIAKKETIH